MTIKNISLLADELIAKVASVNPIGEEIAKAQDEERSVMDSLQRAAKKTKKSISKEYSEVTKDKNKKFNLPGVDLDIPSYQESSKKASEIRKLAEFIRNGNYSNDITYQDVMDYVKLFNK